MLDGVLLLTSGLLLGLYAAHELAPTWWATAAALLRRFATVSPPRPATLREAVLVPDQDRSSAIGTGPRPTQPSGALAPERKTRRVVIVVAPLAVMALAFALRVVKITEAPYGFFCDEASNALDAYWLVHTLHDQHGAFLPAFFEALGPDDWRGGLSIYWSVPFIALLGLSEFAVRCASAVAGTLTVWLTYVFVARAINRPLGLISAFLLAITPWHIMTSRIGFEWISVPLVIALCLWLFFLGLERPRWLPLVFVCAALGVYTHFSGRAFFPLLLVALVIIYAPLLRRHQYECTIGVIAAGIVLIPAILAVFNGTFFAHFRQVARTSPSLGDRMATFWANYQAHFEPGFLFQTSDIVLRHFVRGFGMLYPVEAPFMLIGLAVVIARHRRVDLLLLAWLLLYPIAASTVSPPLISRSIPGVIVLQILAAQGIYAIYRGAMWGAGYLHVGQRYRRALVTTLTGLLLLVGLGATAGFMKAYLVDYPTYSSGWWGWQWGPQKIVPYFEAHRQQYDRELWNAEANAPDELLRFYTTPDTGPCRQCAITNVADPAVVSTDYVPRSHELWALSPEALQGSTLRLVPHRIVSDLTYPGGQVAYLFVATGPQIRPG